MNLDLNVRSLNAFEPCVLAYLVKDHSVLFSKSCLIIDSSIGIEKWIRKYLYGIGIHHDHFILGIKYLPKNHSNYIKCTFP